MVVMVAAAILGSPDNTIFVRDFLPLVLSLSKNKKKKNMKYVVQQHEMLHSSVQQCPEKFHNNSGEIKMHHQVCVRRHAQRRSLCCRDVAQQPLFSSYGSMLHATLLLVIDALVQKPNIDPSFELSLVRQLVGA